MIYLSMGGDERVLGMFERAEAKLRNPGEVLKKIGNVVVTELKTNFPQEGKRLNEPWKALKASTIKERIRLGFGAGPILVRTGTLMGGFQQEVQRFQVRIFNPVEYFKYHQRGGGFLPQRRMIVTPEWLKQEAVATVNAFLKGIFD